MKHLENAALKGRPNKKAPEGVAITFTNRDEELEIDAKESPLTVAHLLRNGRWWHSRASEIKGRSEEQARIANKGLDEIEATEDKGYIRLEDQRYNLLLSWAKDYLLAMYETHMPYVVDQLDVLAAEGDKVLAAEKPATESKSKKAKK